ncbi:MAG: Sapep family Mn(2+)-dependent dipeptidase, partial [Romboutsia sp.]|uniref:Sapep family Mn(2+)-dependent dipeptidase n=1 Tax=Romboutsia sp. TaxID=1965302 RepID=UPI003F2CEB0D
MNEINNIKNERKKELLKLLKEWVKIPSIYDGNSASEDKPFGENVTKALNWFENLGKNSGFNVKNIDNHAVYIEYGDGSEHIDIFGHCDVVNVGDGWESNPFEIKINNDKLIGRGVSDNKGPMIACFLALKKIKQKQIKLNRKVRLIAGGNEESGFKCIKHYYSKEPYGVYGFTPDAKFPVLNGEKGAGTIYLTLNIQNENLFVKGGLEHNTIPSKVEIKDTKKGTESIVEGLGGHSSKPQNAINPIPKSLINLYNEYNEKWMLDLYKIINEKNIDGNLFDLNKEGKCGIISIVPTVIEIKDKKVEIILNVRYPEILEFDEIKNSIKDFILKAKLAEFSVAGNQLKKSNYIDENSKLVKILHDIYIKYSNDTNSIIRVTSAGSYASEMN